MQVKFPPKILQTAASRVWTMTTLHFFSPLFRDSFRPSPATEHLFFTANFKDLVKDHLNPLRGHTKFGAFCIKKAADRELVEMWVKEHRFVKRASCRLWVHRCTMQDKFSFSYFFIFLLLLLLFGLAYVNIGQALSEACLGCHSKIIPHQICTIRHLHTQGHCRITLQGIAKSLRKHELCWKMLSPDCYTDQRCRSVNLWWFFFGNLWFNAQHHHLMNTGNWVAEANIWGFLWPGAKTIPLGHRHVLQPSCIL